MRPRTLAHLLSCFLTTSFALAQPAASSPPASSAAPAATGEGGVQHDVPQVALPPVSVALTISGGVSLGSYEAGLNWALVRYLKAHRKGGPYEKDGLSATDLRAVSGASAGNINAVLSAMTWCMTDAHDLAEGVETNVFYRTWVPLGFEQLLPREKTCDEYKKKHNLTNTECKPGEPVYWPEDGAFTRRAAADSEAELKALLSRSDTFRSQCSLPIGITVTKEIPEQVREPGAGSSAAGLDVTTQRFAVLLRAATSADLPRHKPSDEGLRFYQIPSSLSSQLIGKRLFVATLDVDRLRDATLFDVVEASSAFPVAFGPKWLTYCDEAELVGETGCPEYLRRRRARFFDGGVFDNLPIGLAMELNQWAQKGETNKPRTRVMYLDPSKRRRGKPKQEEQARTSQGSSYLLGIIGRFVDNSQYYELQTTVRFAADKLGYQRPMPTSRLAPIMGEKLGHFGAFLAKPFRQYDFYVGIYDGMWAMADQACQDDPGFATWEQEEHARCVITHIAEQHRQLRLSSQPSLGANYVVRTLLRYELDAWLGHDRVNALLEKMGPSWRSWVNEPGVNDPLVKALTNANLRLEQDAKHRQGASDAAFTDVLAEVKKERPGMAGLSDVERELFEDPEDFLNFFMKAMSNRLVEIEGQDKESGMRGLMVAAQLGVHAYTNERDSRTKLVFSPATIPESAGAGWQLIKHTVPYNVTLDVANGGIEAGYRPTLHWNRSHALTLPFSPISYNHSLREGSFRAGISAMAKPDSVALNSIELGPYVRHAYPPKYGGVFWPKVGGELAITALLGRVRVAFDVEAPLKSIDNLTEVERQRQPNVFIRVGFADVPGDIYWGLEFF